MFEHRRIAYIDLREKGAIQDIMRTVIVKRTIPSSSSLANLLSQ